MIGFARTDTSIIANWWWTVDRWTLAAVGGLIGFGILLTLAASPAVADRIGYDSYYFVKRQMIYLLPAVATVIGLSMLETKGVRRFGIILFATAIVLMIATLVLGNEIKGARRWLNLAGFSLQSSELVKPAFAVIAAWLMSTAKTAEKFPGLWITIGLYGLTAMLLVAQPDIGQTALLTAIFFAEFFIAGMPLTLIGLAIVLAGAGAIGAYYTLPHFASRIDRFLDPASGDSYQVATGMEAFMNGGLFGRGPGEGTVKEVLPDAHSDFIFAVAGEELGLIACLIIVALFAAIVLRGIARSLEAHNLFVLLAVTGLLTQFGAQAIIHMASTLSLMPTKGMTLPFISYGGSSLIGIAITIGLTLALTRKRVRLGEV
jgi:cell division protein FtsW